MTIPTQHLHPSLKTTNDSEAVLDNTTCEQVSAAKELSPREEKVLRMRYGIGEPTQYSLEEIKA